MYNINEKKRVSKSQKVVFEVEDYAGKIVIFTEKKLKQKSIQHPELQRKAFLKRVKEALMNPDEVWTDFDDPVRKKCYYKKYSTETWAKVVVLNGKDQSHVVTAFQINKIKEAEYSECKNVY